MGKTGKKRVTKKKIPSKLTQRKEIRDLRQQMGILRNQLQQVSASIAQNFNVLNERTMINWQYLWGAIETLKMRGNLEFMTEENIEKFKGLVLEQWREKALVQLKDELNPGQAVCEKCHTVAGGPEFFEEDSETSKCPNCKVEGTAFLKDTEVVSDEIKEAS